MLARRAVLRAMPRMRGVATDAGAGSWKQQQEALRAHAAGMDCPNLPARTRRDPWPCRDR